MSRSQSVGVGFTGLDTAPEPPVQARIQPGKRTRGRGLPDEDGFRILPALILVRLLGNSRWDSAITAVTMRTFGDAAQAILDGEVAADEYRFRDHVPRPGLGDWPIDDFSRAPEQEVGFGLGVPVLTDFLGRAEMEVRYDLHVRGERAWAMLKLPVRGTSYWAAYGLMALLEHLGNDPAWTTRFPDVLHAVGAVYDWYAATAATGAWQDRGLQLLVEDAAVQIALQDDSAAAREQIMEPLIAASASLS